MERRDLRLQSLVEDVVLLLGLLAEVGEVRVDVGVHGPRGLGRVPAGRRDGDAAAGGAGVCSDATDAGRCLLRKCVDGLALDDVGLVGHVTAVAADVETTSVPDALYSLGRLNDHAAAAPTTTAVTRMMTQARRRRIPR